MNLWYVFCISMELHLLGLNSLWARLQTSSSHWHWDEETLFLLISYLWVAGFSVFVGTTTSEFRCENQFLWSWASAFLFIFCFCQEYLLSWCQLCCLWNSAKERIQLILCQNGEAKELKESKQCYNQGRHPPSQYHPASWHVSLSLPSAVKEHSSILNRAVFPVSASQWPQS